MPGYSSFSLSKTKYADRYWNLTKNSGTFGSYTGVFDYGTTNLVGGAVVSNLRAGVYDGSNWTYPSSSGSGTAVTATSIAALGNTSTTVALAECISPIAYNVTGGGAYCSGRHRSCSWLWIILKVVSIYQLQIGGVDTLSLVAGTGSAISFGNQTSIGT